MAMSVKVAEEAVTPSAKRERRHRLRYAYVDSNVPATNLISKAARRFTTSREQTRHVAEVSCIDHLDRVVEIACALHRHHGPEYLGLRERIARRNIVDHSRSDKETIVEVDSGGLAAVDHERRPFGDAMSDDRLNPVATRGGDDRTELAVLGKSAAEPSIRSKFTDSRDERIGVSDGNHRASGKASLPGISERAFGCGRRDSVERCVGQYDQAIFRAALRLRAFA
jgi:hypothetical protein